MYENISPFRKKKSEIKKNCMKQPTKQKTKSMQLVMIILFRLQWNTSLNRLLLYLVIYGLLSSLTAALTPCPEWASGGRQLPQRQPQLQASPTSHHHKALQEPHPAVVLLMSSRSHWTQGAAHAVASFSSTPGAGGSAQVWDTGWVLTQWDLCRTVTSPRAGVCRYPLAQRSGCGEGKVPICCLHWLLTGHAVTSSHPSPDTECFHTSISLHTEPVRCHSQSLYLNKPFCWTQIKYSPVESDTMREPRLEARERMRRRSQLNKYI